MHFDTPQADGERLASGGAGTLRISRVATGEKLLHIQVPKGGDIFSLRFTTYVRPWTQKKKRGLGNRALKPPWGEVEEH